MNKYREETLQENVRRMETMSLDDKKRRTTIRKKMFKVQSKITWSKSDAGSKAAFDEIMRLRNEYRKAGGVFKK